MVDKGWPIYEEYEEKWKDSSKDKAGGGGWGRRKSDVRRPKEKRFGGNSLQRSATPSADWGIE